VNKTGLATPAQKAGAYRPIMYQRFRKCWRCPDLRRQGNPYSRRRRGLFQATCTTELISRMSTANPIADHAALQDRFGPLIEKSVFRRAALCLDEVA